MTRIGIYGGTFSPPHVGHLAAARAFMEQMWLDLLYVIPTSLPPHKEMEVAVCGEDRLNMCRLAFGSMEGVYVSDMELRRGGKSYTVDTLRELSGEDRRLFLLCGTDMMLTLDTWREPEEIFRLCYPVYIRREREESLTPRIIEKNTQYRQQYGKAVPRVLSEPIPISSGEIRKGLAAGEDVSRWLTPAVAAYIRDHHLYV